MYLCYVDVYLMVYHVPGTYNNNEPTLTKCQALCFKNLILELDQGRFYWLLLSPMFYGKEMKLEVK